MFWGHVSYIKEIRPICSLCWFDPVSGSAVADHNRHPNLPISASARSCSFLREAAFISRCRKPRVSLLYPGLQNYPLRR